MKAILLRIGIDKGLGGALGPIFSNGFFEYIPIPENYIKSSEKRIFSSVLD